MKKILLLCFSVWLSLASWAYSFEEDGIYYSIVSENDATCEVTWGGSTRTVGTASYVGEVAIPATVTYENVTYTVIGIGTYAFNSSELTSLTISNGVTYMGDYACQNCLSLSKVNLSDDMISIARYAFSGCTSLEAIYIPDEVTTIGNYAFSYSGLKSIEVPFNVTSIGTYAFTGCESLVEANVDCNSGLGIDTFLKCYALERVTLGEGVISIGDSSFDSCSALKSITSMRATPPSISKTNVFTSVDKTTCIIYVPDGSVDLYKAATGWKDFYNIMVIGSSDVPFADGTKFEWDGLYYNVVSAEDRTVEVTWGGGSNTAGTTSYTGKITIPATFTYGEYDCTVIGIGEYAFYGCTLTSVSIPETVGYIGTYAFYSSNITSLTLPDSVTDLGDYACMYCRSLTDVVFGNGITEINVQVFNTCTGLKNVTFGDNVIGIDYGAFYQCTALESITIPETVVSIGQQAFHSCSSLKNVTFGNSLETLGWLAFAGTAIEELVLPNSLVSFTGQHEFYDNPYLKKVTLGNAVENLANYTFFKCTGMEEFYSPIATPPSGATWSFLNADTDVCILYVPVGSKEAYASASGWEDFVNIVEMTEFSIETFSATNVTDTSATLNGSVTEAYNDPITEKGFEYWTGNEEALKAVVEGDEMTATVTDLTYSTEYTYRAYAVMESGTTEYGEETTFITTVPDGINGIHISIDSENVEGIYSTSGLKLNAPQKGVNIVRYTNGTSKKVIMK